MEFAHALDFYEVIERGVVIVGARGVRAMANIEVTATTGRRVLFNAETIEQVRTKLRGGHLLPGDEGSMRRARSTTR